MSFFCCVYGGFSSLLRSESDRRIVTATVRNRITSLFSFEPRPVRNADHNGFKTFLNSNSNTCISKWIHFSTIYKIITKGGLISEGILTLVPLPKRSANSLPWAENLNKLFTVKGRKFKLSAEGRDLALFVGNGTKVKIPSEIKLLLRIIFLV